MRWILPKWLKQIVGGLSDGAEWSIRRLQELPIVVRLGGWAIFQAVLFKVQPQLWRGLVTLTATLERFETLGVEIQLLLLAIALVPIQTAVIVFTLKDPEIVVSIVSSTDRNSLDSAVADGGIRTEHDENDRKPITSGFGAILGVISGAAFGSIFGPAGTIGVAVLGAILGDEYERRKREDTHTVVHHLEG